MAGWYHQIQLLQQEISNLQNRVLKLEASNSLLREAVKNICKHPIEKVGLDTQTGNLFCEICGKDLGRY